jgi:hypothetical protein
LEKKPALISPRLCQTSINNHMEAFKEILLVTIPALLVLLGAWVILNGMLKTDHDRRRQEIILQNSRTITPIRLQAYERIILFLERISLESLLVRINAPDMSATQLHTSLLATIRSEFEHNLSQQIYMTADAWEVVKNARSNMIRIINTEAEKIPADAQSITLSRKLLETIMDLEKEPTRVAIEFVKAEVARLL